MSIPLLPQVSETYLPWPSRLAVPCLLALALMGCVPGRPTEPTTPGDALPGSFYLTSEPTVAPNPLVIRLNDSAGPYPRNEEFEQGDEVTFHWSTLPLPSPKWIEVNGTKCDGTFTIEARVETDILLNLSGDVCSIAIVGSHPEGTVHLWPDD